MRFQGALAAAEGVGNAEGSLTARVLEKGEVLSVTVPIRRFGLASRGNRAQMF